MRGLGQQRGGDRCSGRASSLARNSRFWSSWWVEVGGRARWDADVLCM